MIVTVESPVSFAIGGRRVVLDGVSTGVDECKVELRADGVKHLLSFSPYYTPACETSESEVAIWGGARLYIFDVVDNKLRSFERDDEIHEVYPFGRLWCIRGEISVVVVEPNTGQELKRLDHNEVILSSRREGNQLVMQDLVGRTITFSMDV